MNKIRESELGVDDVPMEIHVFHETNFYNAIIDRKENETIETPLDQFETQVFEITVNNEAKELIDPDNKLKGIWKLYLTNNEEKMPVKIDVNVPLPNIPGIDGPITMLEGEIVAEPGFLVNINNSHSLDSVRTSYDPAPEQNENAPEGVYTITATFRNVSAQDISNISFKVATLTGGNLLLNTYNGSGGVNSIVMVPNDALGGNGVLDPDESFTVDFEIGLATRASFQFFVDAYGVVE